MRQKRVLIPITAIALIVAAATWFLVQTQQLSVNDLVQTAADQTCGEGKPRYYDTSGSMTVTHLTENVPWTSISFETSYDGDNFYSRAVYAHGPVMEAIRREGVVYLRTISQNSPWVIQSQPSEEELLAVDGDLLGMCGDSGDMASNPVARALGPEASGDYRFIGEESADGISVKRYTLSDATERALDSTMTYDLIYRDVWIDSRGYIIRAHADRNVGLGNTMSMVINFSGQNEPNVITAPVVPTLSP